MVGIHTSRQGTNTHSESGTAKLYTAALNICFVEVNVFS